jgi:glutaredoxin
MVVEIYGKKDCGLCAAAKDKMRIMAIPCEVFDIEEIMRLHPGWSTDGSVERLARLAFNDVKVPTVVVDGVPYRYSAAMAKLKAMRTEGN